MVKESQNEKLIRVLTSKHNATITEKQARTRLGIKNLSARVCDLRDCGFNIETIPAEGRKVRKYTLGNPVMYGSMFDLYSLVD